MAKTLITGDKQRQTGAGKPLVDHLEQQRQQEQRERAQGDKHDQAKR